MNLIEQAKKQIDALLQSAYQKASEAGALPAGAAIVLLACAMFAVSFVAARFRSK